MPPIDETHVETLLRGVVIPSRPTVLTELMTELDKPLTNGKQVARLITTDPGLAAGVLMSANSAAFSGGRQIASIADATRVLGFGAVLNMVVEALLRRAIATGDAALARFWDNAVYTAAISAELAGTLGGTRRDTAYTFGLLHDCGIPLMMQRFPAYKTVLEAANAAEEESFTAVEEAAVGTNHATVGYFLARSWGLPAAVCQALLAHHDYAALDGASSPLDKEACTLVAISLVANYVAGNCLRVHQDAEWPKGREAAAAYLGYSPAELDDVADDLVDHLTTTMSRSSG